MEAAKLLRPPTDVHFHRSRTGADGPDSFWAAGADGAVSAVGIGGQQEFALQGPEAGASPPAEQVRNFFDEEYQEQGHDDQTRADENASAPRREPPGPDHRRK